MELEINIDRDEKIGQLTCIIDEHKDNVLEYLFDDVASILKSAA